MRCKKCDHPLWNQPVPPEGVSRVCSECGTPYAVADFEFRRGRVKFCCPTCDKPYYGTSLRGHLEPERFDCVGCGANLTMERCLVRAHDMEREHEAMQKRDLPWLDQAKMGWFRRWWRTANFSTSFQSAVPHHLIRAPQPMRAVGFVLMNATIAYGFSAIAYILLPAVFGNMNLYAGIPPARVALALLSFVALVLATAAFAAIPALLCARLTKRGEPIGFARGYELAAYSTGALLVLCIPCCGGLAAALLLPSQTIGNFVAYFADEPKQTRVLAGVLSALGFVLAAVGVYLVYL